MAYTLESSLLVIGFSLKLDSMHKPFTSVYALLDYCDEREIPLSNIVYTIYEITPNQIIPFEKKEDEDTEGVGYRALPTETILEHINFHFINHSPKKAANKYRPHRKDVWVLHSDDNADWCKMLVVARKPYQYERIDVAMTKLANYPGGLPLVNSIVRSIGRRETSYDVFKKESCKNGYFLQYFVEPA